MVGIADEHSSLVVTIAPAAFANLIVRSSGQPDSSPWHSAPPNPSPAPMPLTTSTRIGGTSTVSSRVFAYTPSGPRLTTASSTPKSSSASAASFASVLPTAVSHSSRLPTATVTCGSARWTWARAASRDAQKDGR